NPGKRYTLAAASSGLSAAASNFFNVAGAPAQLAFTNQPASTTIGGIINSAIGVKVSIEDVNGSVVTNSTAPVTIAIATNPGGGALNGDTTVSAVNGVATFTGLSINRGGVGYTLAASGAGLAAAFSKAFNIVSAVLAGQPATGSNC